jgi:hypothetical protein
MKRDAHGFEIWTARPQRREDQKIYLHVDCGEKLRTSAGVVRTPLLGSVLYLGPEAGLVGGETLFVIEERLCKRFGPYLFHDWAALAAETGALRVSNTVPAISRCSRGTWRMGKDRWWITPKASRASTFGTRRATSRMGSVHCRRR